MEVEMAKAAHTSILVLNAMEGSRSPFWKECASQIRNTSLWTDSLPFFFNERLDACPFSSTTLVREYYS